jgi:hypothetical protein
MTAPFLSYHAAMAGLANMATGGPDIDAGATVASGGSDFGICTTSVLVNPAQRANNVVLAVIFQHSAAASWCHIAPASAPSPNSRATA